MSKAPKISMGYNEAGRSAQSLRGSGLLLKCINYARIYNFLDGRRMFCAQMNTLCVHDPHPIVRANGVIQAAEFDMLARSSLYSIPAAISIFRHPKVKQNRLFFIG